MNIKYIFCILIIILLLVNCESVLTKNNEVEDSSEEIEEDKEDLEITKKTTKILGKIYASVFANESDETDESGKKLKPKTYRSNLFQKDVILTKYDAKTLIENALNEARDKMKDVTKLKSELRKDIEDIMSDSDFKNYDN
uniref:Uncharacterized protein n=1 Tax=Strongyloides venezuelensis TaxID=75913 RepID=A0A0K0FC87_STRVS